MLRCSNNLPTFFIDFVCMCVLTCVYTCVRVCMCVFVCLYMYGYMYATGCMRRSEAN